MALIGIKPGRHGRNMSAEHQHPLPLLAQEVQRTPYFVAALTHEATLQPYCAQLEAGHSLIAAVDEIIVSMHA